MKTIIGFGWYGPRHQRRSSSSVSTLLTSAVDLPLYHHSITTPPPPFLLSPQSDPLLYQCIYYIILFITKFNIYTIFPSQQSDHQFIHLPPSPQVSSSCQAVHTLIFSHLCSSVRDAELYHRSWTIFCINLSIMIRALNNMHCTVLQVSIQ